MGNAGFISSTLNPKPPIDPLKEPLKTLIGPLKGTLGLVSSTVSPPTLQVTTPHTSDSKDRPRGSTYGTLQGSFKGCLLGLLEGFYKGFRVWGLRVICTQIVYTLAPKYLYRDYFKAKIYTTWVYGPLGKWHRRNRLLLLPSGS